MADRFLHIRVLLYRPLFVQLCEVMSIQAKASAVKTTEDNSRPRSQLYGAFAEKCSVACIETARALISHISDASATTFSGSPWYNCYCITYLPVKGLFEPSKLIITRYVPCCHGSHLGRSAFT
jgi:hypothetical protein